MGAADAVCKTVLDDSEGAAMTVFLVVAALAGSPDAAGGPAPATSLALQVARAVGATVSRIAVTTDDSVAPSERVAIDAAFGRAGLFVLVEPAKAAAIVEISRADAATVVTTVIGANGETLWTGRSAWPTERVAAPAPDGAAAAKQTTEEETRLRLAQFSQQRLRIAVLTQSHFGLPALLGDDPAPTKQWQGDPGARAARWGAGRPHGGTARVRREWSVVRGQGDLISEMELARLLENRQLAERIEKARFWPRLFWVGGFGLASSVGVTAGAYFVQSGNQDTRTVGVSMIAVGLVSGALALLYPTVGAGHVLEPTEAQRYCDQFNERLRKKLGLLPSDSEPRVSAGPPPSAAD